MYDASAEDLLAKLNSFLNLTDEERRLQSERVLQAYEENYTTERFAQRYLAFAEDLLSSSDAPGTAATK